MKKTRPGLTGIPKASGRPAMISVVAVDEDATVCARQYIMLYDVYALDPNFITIEADIKPDRHKWILRNEHGCAQIDHIRPQFHNRVLRCNRKGIGLRINRRL